MCLFFLCSFLSVCLPSTSAVPSCTPTLFSSPALLSFIYYKLYFLPFNFLIPYRLFYLLIQRQLLNVSLIIIYFPLTSTSAVCPNMNPFWLLSFLFSVANADHANLFIICFYVSLFIFICRFPFNSSYMFVFILLSSTSCFHTACLLYF